MKLENVADIYPLSPVQEGMLFHTLNAPKSGVYVGQYICKLVGDLQVRVFQSAWEKVLARHSSLSTAFLWDGLDEPLQIVRQKVKLLLLKQDWRRLSSTEQEIQLEELLKRDRAQGFALTQAPLMRLNLIQLSDNIYQLLWSFHHLLSDGWSISIIWKEVLAIYTALCEGQHLTLKPPRPYRDYIAWLQRQDISKAKNFWQNTLKGFTEPTSLQIERITFTQSQSSY